MRDAANQHEHETQTEWLRCRECQGLDAPEPDAASESGVDGTTAVSRLVNGGAEAGVAPGERQDARPGDAPKVGDARSAASDRRFPHDSFEECMAAECGTCAPNPPAASTRVPTEAEIVSLREEIERVQRRAEKYAAALTEITVSRDSFGDDRLYANHAERVAHNALLPRAES